MQFLMQVPDSRLVGLKVVEEGEWYQIVAVQQPIRMVK